ncbi:MULTISPECIES: entericidin [unclassified Moraxella]|uniref:entericidin n=1 Tax=unclassified Moraxella TaxID=2685852 RepID=UPI002B4155C3|nr:MULTISPECIES: entericidin [unclassified Moraxella]
MKKLFIATVALGLVVLTACSQQTKEKTSEAVETAKTDVAVGTAEVAKEAELAAQNATEATKNGVQLAADKTSEVVKEVGARADAVVNPNGAEDKVPEEQKY